MKKLIFVSGPYTAPDLPGVLDNLDRATEAVKDVLLAGHIPVCPHKITALLDLDPELEGWTHEQWLTDFCYPLLDRCDAIYLYPGWQTSKGARLERDRAMATGKVILLAMSDLGEG